MKHYITAIILTSFVFGCAPEEEHNPPPVGPASTRSPEVQQEPPEEEPPEYCTDYQQCALECADIDWGEDPVYGRTVCLAACEVPPFLDEETVSLWGQSCASIDDTTDLCEDGYNLCLHLEE